MAIAIVRYTVTAYLKYAFCVFQHGLVLSTLASAYTLTGNWIEISGEWLLGLIDAKAGEFRQRSRQHLIDFFELEEMT